MTKIYVCKQCGQKVKEESRASHIIADHRDELHVFSSPDGTEGLFRRMYKEVILA